MCSFKPIAIYAAACLFCCAANSQGIIPGSPTAITGGDDVRARDGTACKQGTYQKPTLDFGIAITSNTGDASQVTPDINTLQSLLQSSRNMGNSTTVYARVVIPLGSDPTRIDCTQLYNLEIQRLTMELDRMKSTGSASIQIQ